ncbi:MAG: hypothetical protein E4G99_07810 [Anaerolineales bacterium]|nr:MAG: hypothetical protein E4G99_07810 [Anaerolineales bacterium]
MLTSQLVQKVFNKLFGLHPDAEALREALLHSADKEPPRVHLAILKLSEGDPLKLLQYIEAARIDYRDVLAWAEYPAQMSSGATYYNTAVEVYEAILEADRQQYQSWLEGHRDPDMDVGSTVENA